MNAEASTVRAAIQTAIANPSPYQAALFDWVVNGKGSAIVKAVAGSGKTTTGVEMVKLAPGHHIFLAFNKAIATELSARGVNGRTFHSLCFSPVMRHKGISAVESNKIRDLIREHFAGKLERMYGTFMSRLVSLARNAGIGAGLAPNTTEEWLALVDHHDLEPDTDSGTVEEGVQYAMELLALSNDSDAVDFDDLLYIAVKDGISLPKFDFVFVDEAQDTNAIRRAIIRKIMKPHSRLVAVGDPAQAIYGFTGADSQSMALIAEDFGAVEMPLTVSYRCPKSVVEYAHQWVQHIEPAPGASDGSVTELGTTWDTKLFKDGDLVVCRTTKPLVALAYRLIRDRIPAHVMGREIGQGLVKLVNKMNAKGLDALEDKLTAYRSKEVEKAVARGNEAKAAGIRDKVDCILCVMEGLVDTDASVPGLIRALESIFSDANSGVKLATIHKSKGLEADRVFWMNSQSMPSPWARQEWQLEQENNLCYVATTRAKRELYLIEENF